MRKSLLATRLRNRILHDTRPAHAPVSNQVTNKATMANSRKPLRPTNDGTSPTI